MAQAGFRRVWRAASVREWAFGMASGSSSALLPTFLVGRVSLLK